MIPGPSEPEPEVLAELSMPILPHYGDRWKAAYGQTTSMMQSVFRTKNEVIIVPLPGQLAVEMAALNMVGEGEDGFVCMNGVFSENVVDAINATGGRAIPINSQLGRGPALEEVKAVIETHGDPAGKSIFLVQNETSTGAATDPKEIFAYCKKKGMFTILDSISAIGGIDVRADDWQADFVIGYSSKALGGINGAVPLSVGKDVWEIAKKKKGKIHSAFLDLSVWREAIDVDSSWGHPHPSSMPTSVIMALRKAVSMALEEGLEARYNRHAEAAKAVRDGMEELGLEVFTDRAFYSNTVSVARVDQGWEGEFRKRLVTDYGIMIAGGLGPLKGKIIRVGTMGSSARREKVAITLAAFEKVLKQVKR